jgi:SpoVK/Ycf46/Vps4 family AAA+-type ATPase
MELDFPNENEINAIIIDFLQTNRMDVLEKLREDMVTAFKGLTEFEIEYLLSLAVAHDAELTKKALHLIIDQKRQIIMKAGILEMVPFKESIDDIGGLENLKEWLSKKEKVFKDAKNAKAFGVSTPKGVLIAGIPGCGKSLTAKAAGALFDVPLLKLDMGRIMGRYVGESEENMRKAIRLAEAISPCVLWVDELEKALAGIGDGGGSEVTTRLFGTFLTWMQDKTSPVFVLATANKITKLPPELLRKGRFDEIFYVPLPNDEERKKIFEIHIKKRRGVNSLNQININNLIAKTKGYTGADIEGVVSESVENVFVKGSSELTTNDILECINTTHSLSEIMKDELETMDKEYNDRKFKKASK